MDTLQSFRTNPTNEFVIALFNAVDKISGKARLYWKMYLFNSVSRRKIETIGIRAVKQNIPIITANSDTSFKEEFFKLLHLFKAKSLLDDY